MEMTIVRTQEDDYQTLGEFYFDKSDFTGKTLELPDKGNQRNISRIPEGEYTVVRRYSQKYGSHFHIKDVEGRDHILIHHGNYKSDIQGCILVGRAHIDINRDGHLDVTSSKVTMGKLNRILPNEFLLTIM
jgi:hypothetical protein